MDCAYCERPLICDACQASHRPTDPDDYRALSSREEAVTCSECGQVLVCHWCKTPYDGQPRAEAGPADDT